MKPATPNMNADARIRRALRRQLPGDFGCRQPMRLGWLALALAMTALHLVLTHAVLTGALHYGWMLPTFLAAAFTWPYFLFVLHELGHGALLPPGPVRRVASALAAYPILLQPTFWTTVHNHHHKFANQNEDHDRRRIAGRNELAERLYEFDLSNPWIVFTLGGAIHVVFYGQLLHFLKGEVAFPVRRRRVLGELAICAVCAAAFIWAFGWQLMFLGWLPSTLAGSTLQSLYLISNHLTRPMTTDADALGTGVSVRLLRDWSHMDFGRHVEHHLFPNVPLSQLRPVTVLLRDHYPERFQEMTILGTLRRLFQLPGYYLTPGVLTDRSGIKRVSID